MASLLAEASSLYDQAEEALRRGDLAEYQRLVNQARDKVRQAQGLVTSSSSSSTSTTTTTTVVASA